MAQTTAIVDKLLTGVSSAYIPKGYISEQLMPRIGSQQTTGKLGKYGKNHLRIESTLMAGRGEARRVDPITRSTTTYSIEGHGLEGIVTEIDRKNVEKPYDAEKDEVLGLSTLIWLDKERSLATTMADTTVITNNVTLSGSAQFSDYANSDPLGRFKTARLAVRDASGAVPDTAWMDWDTFNTLGYHPGILEALGFTQNRAGQLNEAELAKAMGVKRLLVAEGKYNSATEGQSDSLASVWGKHVWFGVMPDRAMPYQVSGGYYVTLNGIKPRQVNKYQVNNPPRATGIIVEDWYDMLISDVNAIYLIKDAIA
jgi:hypothetical protein